MGRVLPVSPHHKLRGTCLPLGERARVLPQVARLVHRHMVAGQLLRGVPTDRSRSLLLGCGRASTSRPRRK